MKKETAKTTKAAATKTAKTTKATKATKTCVRKAAAPKKASAAKKSAPKSTAVDVVFTIQAAPGLPVYVAGTFNNWDPEAVPLAEKDGVYTATLSLEPGEYEYKFIVNGFWTMDPDPSREWRANGLGTLNSVVTVG